MQFTTILSLLVAAAAAQQTTIRVTFYPDGGCHGSFVDDTVFNQATATGCQNIGIINVGNSAFFNESSITRPVQVFNQPGCMGNFVIVQPGPLVEPANPPCRAIQARSYQFI